MILRELLEGTPTQLWDASRISSNARSQHHAEKLHTPGGELGVGAEERPPLRIHV